MSKQENPANVANNSNYNGPALQELLAELAPTPYAIATLCDDLHTMLVSTIEMDEYSVEIIDSYKKLRAFLGDYMEYLTHNPINE